MPKFGFELYKSYIYYKTVIVMNIEDIKGNTFEVDILNTRREGDRLCFMMYNDKLGKLVISICDCTSNPWEILDPKNHLYGSVSMELSDGIIHYIPAVLNIYDVNSRKGYFQF